jgi:hypothetical protein
MEAGAMSLVQCITVKTRYRDIVCDLQDPTLEAMGKLLEGAISVGFDILL